MSGKRSDSAMQNASSAAAGNQAQGNALTALELGAYKNMFGPGGQGGELGGFTNPNSLNVTRPTGPQALEYQNARANTANQFQNARGQLARYMANRGFGSDSPSGFEAANERQLALGEAGAQGQNFTNYTMQSYNNALRNFWNAQNLQAGQSAALGGQGAGLDTNAANVYANLYANSYTPSIWQSLIPAAGLVGAAVAGGAKH